MLIYTLILPLLGFTVYSVKKKENVSISLVIMNLLCTFTMYLYATSLWVEQYSLVFLFANFYYASVPWLLFSVVNFMMIFTELSRKNKSLIIRLIIFALCLCDLFSFIINLNYHNVLDIVQKTDENGVVLGWVADYRWPFNIHLALSYLQVIIVGGCLILKILRSSRIFRIKYEIVFGMFMLIIGVNVMFLTALPFFDFSILGYVVCALYLCYSSLYSMPKYLSSQMMKLISENINHAIVCFDSTGNKIFSNKKAAELYRYRDYVKHLNELVDENNSDSFMNSQIVYLNEEECFFEEDVNREKDNKNRLIGVSVNISDNTKVMKKMEKELYISTHDELTGLYNRRSFFENAASIIRNNKDTQFYLVATNIKDFKMINTCFGTEFGDEVLIEQAKKLLLADYPKTIHGRISSDNFAMLIPKENFSQKLSVKNTSSLQALFENLHYEIRIYIGIYEVSDIYESVSAMYDKAQIAIRSIYGSYDKTLVFYDRSLMEQLYEEKNIVSDFEKYIKNGAFEVNLTPLFTCDTEDVCGAQIVTRWNNPVNGILNEDEYTDLLDKTMLLHKLDYYVWEETVKILSEWKKKDINLKLSVKIHQQSFYYLNLPEVFKSLVNRYQINAASLVLGVNENCFTRDVKMHVDVLNKLHEAGFKIELDGFGSQFSSLNILKDINADVLKINFDQFYQNEQSDRTLTIIDSMISMSKAIGMVVTAQCVEFEHQKDFLRRAGCDIIQNNFCNMIFSQKEFEKMYMGSLKK
ncbi:EAL domain-containing protein [Treponema sp.]|uniref:EAL domain-containing protein n=1 Tax=Treponema sp. TaxID=166 RepID=UPI0025F1FA64|nr:EAL domain-containing protein [Treponema sp.]MCR5217315.1 EAL domain-containing protein [Treponema sp.]